MIKAPDAAHYRPLKELRLFPENYNVGDVGLIANSINRFGFLGAVRVWQDNMVIAGNHTVKALMSLKAGGPVDDFAWPPKGIIEYDDQWYVRWVDAGYLSYTEAKAFAIADNEIARQSTRDEAKLAELLVGIYQEDSLLGEATGIDGDSLDELLTSLGGEAFPDAKHEEEDVPEASDELLHKWGVEPGQVWAIPSDTMPGLTHRIMCGDSSNLPGIQRLLAGERPTCVFADPPYGVAIGDKNKFLNEFQKAGRNLDTLKADDMEPEALMDILRPIFVNVKQVVADDCSIFVCSAQGGELGEMMLTMMREAGLPVRHVLNWVKNQPTFSMGRLDYEYQHEPILFTWKKTHKRIMAGEHKTSTWAVDRPRASKEHPTMKPVELALNAILNHTEVRDAVFDPFLGSGTTVIAAESCGRVGYGIDISPAYIAVTLERLEMLGLKPELVSGE